MENQEILEQQIQEIEEQIKAEFKDKKYKNMTLKECFELCQKFADKVKIVSHVLKFTHSDAKGTNIRLKNLKQYESYVDTSALQENLANKYDVIVTSATYATVSKFLSIKIGQSVMYRLIYEQKQALKAVVKRQGIDPEKWFKAMQNIFKEEDLASHRLMRQIYFPLGNNKYHLLCPVFPSSLVQVVYEHIQEVRFSDENKEAKKAKSEKRDFDKGYIEYYDLLKVKFGGENPQNISCLNSKRGGENFFFSSCPPVWKQRFTFPGGLKTVFYSGFNFNREVAENIKYINEFLTKEKRNNMEIRNKRKRLIQDIIDNILNWAELVQSHNYGFTVNNSRLEQRCEQLWLDPFRSLTDEAFKQEYLAGAWINEVSKRFAAWFLEKLKISAGDAEFDYIKEELKEVLFVREEVTNA